MRACALILSILLVPASSALGQAGTPSLDALRRELGRGDAISVVREGGESLTGRLLRIGDRDLDIRISGPHGRDVTILLDDVRSLERRRDSLQNGALIGAGIGGGFFGAVFIYAAAVDRNEMDEWAAGYLMAGAVTAGLAALVGAAIDAMRSKPAVRFDRGGSRAAKLRVVPLAQPRHGAGLGVGVRVAGW